MKKSTLVFLMVLGSLPSIFGQDERKIIVPVFDDMYSKYVAGLESGQTDIDYQVFRFSFVESQQFVVANERSLEFDSLEKEMYNSIGKKNYAGVVKTTKEMLSIDYTSMIAHKILQQTSKILGDTLNSKKYKTIEFGLLKSIVEYGDGKSCETSWPVIQIEEEYFILDMLDAKLQRQTFELEEGYCDKMDVKIGRKKKTYYFEVSMVFAGYKKLE